MSAQVDVLSVMDKYRDSLCNRRDAALERGDTVIAEFWRVDLSELAEARAAVVGMIAERDALVQEVERLRRDCSEAYQVVGAGMFGEPCMYTQADVERALDNLSAAANSDPRPHDDLLPWPSAALTTGESA